MIQSEMAKIVSRMTKKGEDLQKVRAFTTFQHFAKAKEARQGEQRAHASADLARVLHSLHQGRLSDAFSRVNTNSLKHRHDMSKLKHCILHNLHYRLQHFFDKWRATIKREDIAHEVNTVGQVAVDLDTARKRANIL